MAPKKKMSQQKNGKMQSTYSPSSTNASRPVVTRQGNAPKIMNLQDGGTRVVNSELLINTGTLLGASGMAVRLARPFNPCDNLSWPWLAGVAINYAQYRVNSVELTWVPSCPVTAIGELQMGVMYDYLDTVTYVNDLYATTQLSNLSEFCYGAAYQGGCITQDFKKVSSNWMGVKADVKRIHAARNRFYCTRSGLYDPAYENQVDACHFLFRSYTPAGTTQVATGQLLISYDVTFYHSTIAAAQVEPTAFAAKDFTIADDNNNEHWYPRIPRTPRVPLPAPKPPKPVPVPPADPPKPLAEEFSYAAEDMVEHQEDPVEGGMATVVEPEKS